MSSSYILALGMLCVAIVVTAAAFACARNNAAAKKEIMRQLADGKWHYGLDLVEASNGILGRKTIYIHLSLLEELRFVESRFEQPLKPDHLPRRLYRQSILVTVNSHRKD